MSMKIEWKKRRITKKYNDKIIQFICFICIKNGCTFSFVPSLVPLATADSPVVCLYQTLTIDMNRIELNFCILLNFLSNNLKVFEYFFATLQFQWLSIIALGNFNFWWISISIAFRRIFYVFSFNVIYVVVFYLFIFFT